MTLQPGKQTIVINLLSPVSQEVKAIRQFFEKPYTK